MRIVVRDRPPRGLRRRWRHGTPVGIAVAAGLGAGALALGCGSATVSPEKPAAAAADRVEVLSPGRPLERRLEPGERHRYRLELAGDRYLRVLARQLEIDVELALVSPAGVRLEVVDGPAGRRAAEEQLSALVAGAGEHALEVGNVGDAAGLYRLELEELRPARAGDELRVAGERLIAESEHLRRLEERRPAIERLRRAAELFREAGLAEHEAVALNRIGLNLAALGEPDEALRSYLRALELWEQSGARDYAAFALTNVGGLYRERGELREALRWLRRADAVWRDLGSPPEAAATLDRLGIVYCELGEIGPGLEALGRVLEIWRQARDHREAGVYNRLGYCHRKAGDLDAALDNYRRALELAEERGQRRLQASASSNAGMVHRLRGEFRAAIGYYARAERLSRELGSPWALAPILRNLGTLYVELGQPEDARRSYREAESLYRALDNRAQALHVARNLSWIHISLGETERALAELERALEASRELDDAPLAAGILLALGFARLERGEPRQALTPLEEALETFAAIDPGRAASAHTHLGRAFFELGELDAALEHLERARDLSRRLGSPLVEGLSLLWMARARRGLGELERAHGLLAQALELTERQRAQVPTPELRATFFARKRQLYEDSVDVLVELDELRPASGYAARAFEVSERARARSLLDLLYERRQEVERGIDPRLKERERRLEARLSAVQQRRLGVLSAADATEAEAQEIDLELRELDRERRRLELEIRRRHPRYAELRYPEPVTLAEVQRRLPRDAALVEYVVGREAVLAFVVTSETVWSRRLEVTADELERQVRRARSGLVERGRRQLGSYQLAAHQLYRWLIAPALEPLAGKSRLVIVPDKSLHYLPFEALLTSPPSGTAGAGTRRLPYLLRTWTVSYAPSASVLASLGPAAAVEPGDGGPSFVAFADPVFDRGRWRRLEHSRREVEAIAGLYPRGAAALFLGAEATEANAKNDPRVSAARRLHFATHGLLDERDADYYGLVLALDRGSGEDGLLQVYEVFNLELSAEQVVLSACETALGEELTGEGLVGLSRAFLYAGASRVAVSLWPVEDRSTAELMFELYRRLDAAGSPAEALRDAKLALVEEGRSSHPATWAPFILIGQVD